MTQQLLDETIQKTVGQFTALDEKICHFGNIMGVLGWDARTYAPKKGRPIFAKAKGTLSTEMFKLSISPEMGNYLEDLTKPDVFSQLDPATQACVRERNKEYNKSKSIPSDVYNEYVILSSNANDAWEEARSNDDFSHFEPYLEKMIDMKKQFAEYYGYEKHPYDALLDDFEPGLTVEKLDPLFSDLREKSIDLLNRIQQSSSKPRNEVFDQTFDVAKQKAFAEFIIPKLGYDLDAGRLDETTHPFAMGINTGDVRITTRYEPENMRMAIFGTIHETGHALYEQGVNAEYEGRVIRRGASFGIHESQSRFLENFVGRTKEFWTFFYDDLKQHFPHELSGISLEEFYRAINCVEPSLIRVEADELTYNLHIMVRYEIEKSLIAGDIQVKDLPNVWNEKMVDYLGITPPSNRLGVLQDVHWSHGGVGYFPSYSLGNLYGAQMLNKVVKDLPDFYSSIQNGEFMNIREWLRENIHQYGKLYTPAELIKKVTGEELNAKYLVDYLEQKYTKIYNL
ncbi:carboxypeptidase M32 [Pseudalkalibacillus decolorationis]|uniref:carboxypeptidase M32 n=1 Tax=Pseudalkalibacillus decolorationis TaxID=163879 RepID=UPI002148C806|nr:carboxypeptidase M32 [Pseudalkalibacillus decolorationis]